MPGSTRSSNNNNSDKRVRREGEGMRKEVEMSEREKA